MLLSTQNDILGREFGEAESIRMLKAAGFDAYDFSMFRMVREEDYILNQPGWREYVRGLRQAADDCGIVCNQAHAPFPSARGEADYDPMAYERILRSIEIAAMLGAKNIIVHPIHHLPYAAHREELKQINIEFYRGLVPLCQQLGIRVACENMWQRSPLNREKIVDSACSRAEEFCDYIDSIGSPWIVACLDVGHAPLVGEDLTNMIHALGRDRLQALHVHDNSCFDDDHTLPYTRSMDFDAITRALHDIDYQGDFTFEADNFLKKMPRELMADASAFMCRVGRHLVERVKHPVEAEE